MLCMKCSAVVSEDDNFCRSCGKRLKGYRKTKMILGGIAIFTAVAGCCTYIYLSLNGYIDFPGGNEPGAAESPMPDPVPGEAQPSASPVPTVTPDLNRDINNVWADLIECYGAVNRYTEDYAYSTFVSKGGHLYDFAAKAAVVPFDLTETGKLNTRFEEEKIFFLYLKPSDFAGYSEVSFSDSDELTVFAAYETKTGIALYGGRNAGIIYREHLNEILKLYSGGGAAVRPSSNDKSYQMIKDAVLSYESSDGKYDVRYMVENERYAVAVLSPNSDSSVLQGYVLEKNGNTYAVVYSGFEHEKNQYTAANNAVPYMDISLLPPFRLYDSKLLGGNMYAATATSLKQLGQITDSDMPIDFVSGTKEYFYIVFSSGKKFLGINKSGTWDIAQVDDWLSAAEVMLMFEPGAPTYMLRQE